MRENELSAKKRTRSHPTGKCMVEPALLLVPLALLLVMMLVLLLALPLVLLLVLRPQMLLLALEIFDGMLPAVPPR